MVKQAPNFVLGSQKSSTYLGAGITARQRGRQVKKITPAAFGSAAGSLTACLSIRKKQNQN